ncbi:MAG: glycosyltransferase family 39 protein, partial [Clostridia bacterium]|nr:glycosyltransferase family 39 protein [Clostridia bacterium]
TAIVTFHPTLIIMSGSLNNDMLSSLFGMLSLYFTSKWARERKWSSIILTAFSIGLGMFTKLSVGLLAPGVAAVFLYILIKFRKEYKKLIPQFFVFGLICVPIGMFWSIRNLIKFDVPINYVPLLSKDSGQYIDKPPMERLLNWKPFQFMSPFTQWEWSGASYNEFNPVIALWKNAMFDEQTFFKKSITLQSFCTALFVCGIILSLLSVAGFVLMWIKNKNVKLHDKILLTGVALVVFGNYINFCIHFPHVCTENMRYCVPLIFVGAAVIGMMLDSGADSRSVIYKKINDYAKKVMTVFCGLSVFVYVMMMFYYHAVEK